MLFCIFVLANIIREEVMWHFPSKSLRLIPSMEQCKYRTFFSGYFCGNYVTCAYWTHLLLSHSLKIPTFESPQWYGFFELCQIKSDRIVIYNKFLCLIRGKYWIVFPILVLEECHITWETLVYFHVPRYHHLIHPEQSFIFD